MTDEVHGRDYLVLLTPCPPPERRWADGGFQPRSLNPIRPDITTTDRAVEIVKHVELSR